LTKAKNGLFTSLKKYRSWIKMIPTPEKEICWYCNKKIDMIRWRNSEVAFNLKTALD